MNLKVPLSPSSCKSNAFDLKPQYLFLIAAKFPSSFKLISFSEINSVLLAKMETTLIHLNSWPFAAKLRFEAVTGLDSDSQNVFNRYKPPFSAVKAGTDVREHAVQQFIEQNPQAAADLQKQLLDKKIVTSAKPEDALYDWASMDKAQAIEALSQIDSAAKTDLKKILAYSTISHCGFLFLLVIYNNFFALVLYLHLHG
jgi:hypothetical protein